MIVPAYRYLVDTTDVLLTGTLLVRFQDGVSTADATKLADSAGLGIVHAPVPDSGVFFYTLAIPPGTADPMSLANQLSSHPKIKWSTPNFLRGVHRSSYPTDAYIPYQYFVSGSVIYQGVRIFDNPDYAWLETKGAGITVGIIDDGLAQGHPDFDFSAQGGIWVFDAFGEGASAVLNPGGIDNHGTAAGGIIFARHNNLEGVGLAPEASVAVARIFRQEETATDDGIAAAIGFMWSTAHADVVSNSWGGGAPSQAVSDAILGATTFGRNGLGTVMIFAAGNNFAPSPTYPAYLSDVLAVGVMTKDGVHPSYANQNPGIAAISGATTGYCVGDVVTVDLIGSSGCNDGPNGDVNYTSSFSGTSAAAPQVAAAAALVLARMPGLSQAGVRSRLTANADSWGDATNFGAGKLNISAAAGVSQLIANFAGPGVINRKGNYTWTAAPSGGIGSGTYSYSWRMQFVGGSWTSLGSGSSVTMTVYGGDPDFNIELTVYSGAQTQVTTHYIMNCIGKTDCLL